MENGWRMTRNRNYRLSQAGEWHYVAVVLNNGGYDWYVDGERKVSKVVTDFDCSKLVKFANNVPTMTIGG